jgi:hypothetical protein
MNLVSVSTDSGGRAVSAGAAFLQSHFIRSLLRHNGISTSRAS